MLDSKTTDHTVQNSFSSPKPNRIRARLNAVPLAIKAITLVVLIGLIGFGAYKLLTTPAASLSYQTSDVEKGTIVVSVTGSGSVSTANSGSISTNATGVVKNVFVKNGDTVKSGAKIAELELDQTAQQKYLQASASYQSAKNSLAAAQETLYSLQSKMFVANQTFINDSVSRNLVSADPTYIEQNADWLAAEASYKSQQNVISQSQTSVTSAWMSLQQASPTIYAPISGTVTGLSLQKGAVLTAAASSDSSTSTANKVASIQTTAAPTVALELTQVDVPKIKIGDKATITLDALSDKTFTGKIISIDTIGSVSSGVTTYPVVIQLDTQSDEIYSNMSAQATIITNSKSDVLVIPSSAIQTTNGTTTVRVLKNGQAQSVTVTTGIASDTQTEITSGLSEGDQVITSSASTMTGSSVSNQTTSPFSTLGGNRSGGFSGGGQVNIVRTTK